MAIGSLPQTLPCLVVTVDQGLVGTGLFLVISVACSYILQLKLLSFSVRQICEWRHTINWCLLYK